MEQKLLTKKDLAKRWQVSEPTIDRMRQEGIVAPCKNLLPTVRFSEQYILELEGLKLERFSPLERRKLERENETLRKKCTELENVIANIVAVSAGAYALLNKNTWQLQKEDSL